MLAFCSSGYADVYLKTGTDFAPYSSTYASTASASYSSLAFDSSRNCLPGVPGLRHEGDREKVPGTPVGKTSGVPASPTRGRSTSPLPRRQATLYVAYQDGGNHGKQASVMKYAGSGWAYLGSQGFSSGQASKTSIKVSAQGVPYVAYIDAGNGGKATVMCLHRGFRLERRRLGDRACGAADFTALALDSSGTPYVAFQDGPGAR